MRLDAIWNQPFASAQDHMQAEFHWLDARLAAHLRHLRETGRFDDSAMRGLTLQEEHVIAGLTPVPGVTGARPPTDRLREIIDKRAGVGAPPPLYRLAHSFGLSAFERDALVIAAAPALDSRYRSALALAQNDATRRWASPDLIIELLDPEARFVHLAAFTAQAPLMRHQLVSPCAQGQGSALADCPLGVDERIAMALLGQWGGLPLGLMQALDLLDPATEDWAPALLPVETGDAPVTVFEGPRDGGQQALAARRALGAGLGLMRLDLARLPDPTDPAAARFVTLAAREARLTQALLFVAAEETEPGAPAAAALIQLVTMGAPLAIAAGPELAHLIQNVDPQGVARITLPPLDAGDRLAWLRAASTAPVDQDVLARLAWGARLGPVAIGRMRGAAITATHQASRPLPALLRPVQARWVRDDLVLSEALNRQLDELTAFVSNWPKVLGDWGFGASNPQSRHCLALFSGPSGTGKTMAASVVARAAHVPLYRASLAGIFDKYLGETEKQIDRLFDAAAEAGIAVLCDEADALFGARTEQNDAHARYANLTVSHLLQRIEEHEGLVILTSNLPRNMDEAFARRIGHAMAFTLPDMAGRLKLWTRAIPPQAEVGDGVDLAAIAETFELSGGDIRNAALAAAYLAAAQGGPIGMSHLLRAIERELSKAGRTPIAADFGRLATAR